MKKVLSLFLLFAIIAGIFTGCAKNDSKSFQSMEDFQQAKIGVLTGSSFDLLATEYAVAFPKTEDAEPLKAQINEFIQARLQFV